MKNPRQPNGFHLTAYWVEEPDNERGWYVRVQEDGKPEQHIPFTGTRGVSKFHVMTKARYAARQAGYTLPWGVPVKILENVQTA